MAPSIRLRHVPPPPSPSPVALTEARGISIPRGRGGPRRGMSRGRRGGARRGAGALLRAVAGLAGIPLRSAAAGESDLSGQSGPSGAANPAAPAGSLTSLTLE